MHRQINIKTYQDISEKQRNDVPTPLGPHARVCNITLELISVKNSYIELGIISRLHYLL